MSLLAFLRPALRGIARNRRRTFSSILGIVLAITMVAGVNIALDSTTGSILGGLLDQVPFDFMATGVGTEWRNVTAALETAGGVEGVEPLLSVSFVEVVLWDDAGNYSTVTFGEAYGVRPSMTSRLPDLGYQGQVPTEDGTVALASDYMEEQVRVGDTVGLLVSRHGVGENVTTYYYNFTVAGILHSTRSEEISAEPFYGYYGFGFYSPVLLTASDAEAMQEDLLPGNLGGGATFFIWADRNELVEPFSSDATRKNVARMQRNLQRSVQEYGVTVESGNLVMVVDIFSTMILMLRVVFIALSLPALILAVYLGSVGVEMGMEERRREIAILKARGSGDGHVASLLVLEAIVAGAVAGVLGLLFGALASRFLLSTMVAGTGAPVDLAAIHITPGSVTLTIVLAVLFMGAASYRPIRRASKMPVAEGLRRYSAEQTQLEYKPTVDVIMLGLAAFTYAVVFFFASEGAESSTFFMFLCILGPFLLILIPLSPLFLTLGLTRLLTRGTSRVYGWAARAVKPLAKDLWHIVQMNLLRNPKRASRICLLVALGLSFGVLVSTTAETQLAYEERLLRSDIGGDIRVEGYGTNATFRENLTAVDGVREAVPVFILGRDWEGYLTVFDADAYRQSIPLDDYYFSDGGPNAVGRLATGPYAIVSYAFAENQFYEVGDVVRVSVGTTDGLVESRTSYDLEIIAITKALPGMQADSLASYPGAFVGGNVYVDFSAIPAADFVTMNVSDPIISTRYLLDVSGADSSDVADAIEKAYPTTATTVMKEEIAKVRSDPLRGALFHFMVIEVAFIVLIISFGLGLVMYTATLEREVELGNIRARGASGSQVGQLMLGEALSIVLIGVAIGLGTGLLTAAMFNNVLNFPAAFAGSEAALDRPLVFGVQSLSLVLIAVLSLVVAAVVATYRVRYMDLARVLRRRGG